MYQDWITIVGVLMALSSIPQIKKLLMRKKSQDISVTSWGVIWFGQLNWTLYGYIHLKDKPLVISNGLSLVMSSVVLILIVKYWKRN